MPISNQKLRFVETMRGGAATQAETFLHILRQSCLHEGRPEDSHPDSPHFFLIGAAAWSGYDMHFLDTLDAALHYGLISETEVYLRVFNIDLGNWFEQEQLDQYFPGLDKKKITQPPFVGHWINGTICYVGEGFNGRKYVLDMLGLIGSPFVQRGQIPCMSFIDTVLSQPDRYTLNGTFEEIIATLTAFYSGLAAGDPYHPSVAGWNIFRRWLAAELNVAEEDVNRAILQSSDPLELFRTLAKRFPHDEMRGKILARTQELANLRRYGESGAL